MALYRVGTGGKAPAGLSAGDEVVTAGGTYRITGVNADGTYKSELSNRNQTIYNTTNYATRSSELLDRGVSDYTKGKVSYLESGYMPSDTVRQAQAYLQSVQAGKPGVYESRWSSQLDDLYNRIVNRDKFSYDLGTDMLYNQYRQQYQNLGRTAMMDTMGQAAALTGGYGSSYGQSVGQQAYDAYLQKLNDVVPELYGMALNQYNQEGADLYNQYGLLNSREQADYNAYRDSVSDYYNDLSMAQNAYNNAYNQDYQQYADQMAYWAGKQADENAAYLASIKSTSSDGSGSDKRKPKEGTEKTPYYPNIGSAANGRSQDANDLEQKLQDMIASGDYSGKQMREYIKEAYQNGLISNNTYAVLLSNARSLP